MLSLLGNRIKRFRNTPQTLLTQSTGAANDFFGFQVALSTDGNTAIIGAVYDDVGANNDQGSATVFTRTNGTWSQQQTITQTGGVASDYFGYSVALSADGNTAIVGAPYDEVGANTNQGSAIVFTRSSGTWSQQQTITQSGGAAYDFFGGSVALSADGNTAIVGAPSDDVGANSDQGSATVFTRSGSTWTEQQTITQSGGAATDSFGHSVALSADGNTAIIGALYDAVGGNLDQGSATVFTRSGSTWTQQQTLTLTGGEAGDLFGYSVALSANGDIAIVGAILDNVGATSDIGSATVFTRSGSTWTQQQTITKSDGASNDYFGRSVALSADGKTAIVGAPYDNVAANNDQGSATVFTRSGSTWSQQQVFYQSDGVANDKFGYSVALSAAGNMAIVGAPYDAVGPNSNQGSATIFYRR